MHNFNGTSEKELPNLIWGDYVVVQQVSFFLVSLSREHPLVCLIMDLSTHKR
jgi:hypothetical protein